MKKFVVGFTLLTLLGCAGSDGPKGETSWAGKMQETAKSFQALLPYLYNNEAFEKKANEDNIKKSISNYTESIHKIDAKGAEKILGEDPYVLQSLNNLRELSERAQKSFHRGDKKTAQILLKASTNTCFKCHTRQDMGPQSVYWKKFDVSAIDTSEIEKAHLLVSMRQYEDAKLHLKEFLSEKEADGEFDIMYENALHYYLMISLRGQNTFQSSLNFIKAKMLLVKTPSSLHNTLKSWHKDLMFFDKNKGKLKPSLKTAGRILKKNKTAYSEKNLINNLVASGLVHEYLMKEGLAKLQKAKAYRLLGLAYDELVVEGFWDLPEVYFEMCVHYAPKTKLAQDCFKHLKDNLTLGYSGSRGTMIPAKEYERIERLRKEAGL